MNPTIFKAVKNGNKDSCSGITFQDMNPYGDDQELLTARKDTILHVAVKYGNRATTQHILNLYPWLVLEINESGDTPLHVAARLGHSELVKLIAIALNNYRRGGGGGGGGNVSLFRALNEKKDTALHDAVKNRHCDVVDLLIMEDPGLIDICNDAGESPLFIAVDKGFYTIALSILVSISISPPDPRCRSGRDQMTVMHAAAFQVISYPYWDIDFWVIPEMKVPVIIIHFLILLPLRMLISLIRRLLRSLKFKITRKNIITPKELASKLIDKFDGKMLEEKDIFGRTALHYAAYVGNAKIVQLFLEKNTSLAYIKENKGGMSALHICAMEGHNDVITTLIKYCPDVCELLDDNNQTALHVAVKCGRAYSVWHFLHKREFDGIMPNQQDKEGNTPLHVAALSGHLEILVMLAKDPRVEKKVINCMGMTVVDIIRSSTHLPINDKHSLLHYLETLGERQRLEKLLDIQITRTSLILRKCQTPKLQSLRINDDEVISGEEDEEKHNNNIDTMISKSWDKNMLEVNLLVATIIASITFAAVVSMPGGYDDDNKQYKGMPNLREKASFKDFLLFDSVAFGSAVASMIIHFLLVSASKFFGRSVHYPFKTIMALTYLCIAYTVLAFLTAIASVLELTDEITSVSRPAICAAGFSFILPVIMYILSFIFRCYRYNYYVMSTRIYIKASLTRIINM
ncbi:hypothetical protein CsatA_005824 [Cannabis sativa]